LSLRRPALDFSWQRRYLDRLAHRVVQARRQSSTLQNARVQANIAGGGLRHCALGLAFYLELEFVCEAPFLSKRTSM